MVPTGTGPPTSATPGCSPATSAGSSPCWARSTWPGGPSAVRAHPVSRPGRRPAGSAELAGRCAQRLAVIQHRPDTSLTDSLVGWLRSVAGRIQTVPLRVRFPLVPTGKAKGYDADKGFGFLTREGG